MSFELFDSLDDVSSIFDEEVSFCTELGSMKRHSMCSNRGSSSMCSNQGLVSIGSEPEQSSLSSSLGTSSTVQKSSKSVEKEEDFEEAEALREKYRVLRKENTALLLKDSLSAAERARVELVNRRLMSLRSTLMAYDVIGVEKQQKPKDKKRLPQIQDLPKLQEKVTIFQLLDFVFRFHSCMENRCVPEPDRKRYLFEATPSLISGFLKMRENRPFRELLALVPVKLLGPRWKLVILKALKSLQQKPSERLDAFGYQFNLLVAASGTDPRSREAKELLEKAVLPGYQPFWELLCGSDYLFEPRISVTNLIDIGAAREGSALLNHFRAPGPVEPRRPTNCRNCGKPGHLEKECWARGGGAEGKGPWQQLRRDEPQERRGRDLAKIRCFSCREKGHYANECPKKKAEPRLAGLAEEESNLGVPGNDVSTSDFEDEEAYLALTEEGFFGLGAEEDTDGLPKIPISLGRNDVEVWAIFDSGASATLADPSVFDHLEGDLVKRNFQVRRISGRVQETDTAKKVKVSTIQGQAEILIWTLPGLGKDRVLLSAADGAKLGVEIEGIPPVFPERKKLFHETNLADKEGWSGPSEETRLPEKEVEKIMGGIKEVLEENQRLPDGTCCNIRNSHFPISLLNPKPVFTRQYPIPERLSGKVQQRVTEWLEKGWIVPLEDVSSVRNLWNTPLVAAPKVSGGKKEDDIRLCMDLRGVNVKSEAPDYQLPTIADLFFQRHLLLGRRFCIEMDHKALEYLNQSKNFMILDWLHFLLNFDFYVIHCKGMNHVLPDSLSRIFGEPVRDMAGVKGVFDSHELVVDEVPSTGIGKKMKKLMKDILGKKEPAEEDKLALIKVKHKESHIGGLGLFEAMVRDGFYWDGLRTLCDKVAKGCLECLMYNVGRVGFHPITPVLSKLPFDHIAMDLIILKVSSDGFTVILLVIDVATRFVLLRPLVSKEAVQVAWGLLKIFANFGIPKVLQMDNDPSFLNDVVEEFRKAAEFVARAVLTYFPNQNGAAERYVGETKRLLFKLLKGYQENWAKMLPVVQMSLNDRIVGRHMSSPFAVMFARKLNKFEDYQSIELQEVSEEDLIERNKKMIDAVYPAIFGRYKEAGRKYSERKNKAKKEKIWEAGTEVMKMVDVRGAKSDQRWEGPFKVVGYNQATKGYNLIDATCALLKNEVPAARLKEIQGDLEEGEGKILEILKVVDDRMGEDGQEYLVKWKNAEESWEAVSSFHSYKVIEDYWKKKDKKQEKKEPRKKKEEEKEEESEEEEPERFSSTGRRIKKNLPKSARG